MKNYILLCNVKVDITKTEGFESIFIFKIKMNLSSKLKSACFHRIFLYKSCISVI